MQSWGVALCLVLASCGSGAKKQGERGADCYPNGTCNVTLTCVAGLCIAAQIDAGRDGDATDSSLPADALADAAADAAQDARPDAPPDAPPDANCDTVDTSNLADGHHNAGQSCLQAGCHLIGNAGAGAPEYSYAGTLYRDAAGTSVFPGATIEVVLGGSTYKMVVQQNGNFYLPKALGNPPTAAMTGQTLASGCPLANQPMSGALVDNGGNCNNCHRTGGTTSPIHLP